MSERSCNECENIGETGRCSKLVLSSLPLDVMDLRYHLPLVCRRYAEPEPTRENPLCGTMDCPRRDACVGLQLQAICKEWSRSIEPENANLG